MDPTVMRLEKFRLEPVTVRQRSLKTVTGPTRMSLTDKSETTEPKLLKVTPQDVTPNQTTNCHPNTPQIQTTSKIACAVDLIMNSVQGKVNRLIDNKQLHRGTQMSLLPCVVQCDTFVTTANAPRAEMRRATRNLKTPWSGHRMLAALHLPVLHISAVEVSS